MADPFRTPIRRCELCDAEVEPAALGPLAGLSACTSCRAGELDRALARSGLTCTSNEHRNEGTGSMTRFVEVRRPTVLDLAVKLDADTPRGWLRRWLEAGDPEVGDQAFDDRVKVAPADGSFTEPALALLRSPAVRGAVLELTGCGCEVELLGASVFVRGAAVALATMRPLAIALAVAIERAGRPGSEATAATDRCELCGSAAGGPLRSLAGIMACQRCQVWEPGTPPPSWGLQCSASTDGSFLVITVKPLALEAYVRFERESLVSRLTGADYQVGVAAFDKKVSVVANAGSMGGAAETRVLEDEGVRQGILELLDLAGSGGSIDIFARELQVRLRRRGSATAELDEAELVTAKPLALALGLALGRVRP